MYVQLILLKSSQLSRISTVMRTESLACSTKNYHTGSEVVNWLQKVGKVDCGHTSLTGTVWASTTVAPAIAAKSLVVTNMIRMIRIVNEYEE